jgi:hypothetical protein
MVAIERFASPAATATSATGAPAAAKALASSTEPRAWMSGVNKYTSPKSAAKVSSKGVAREKAQARSMRAKKPPQPGVRVFAFRGIRHKYKARGMKLDQIRTKRLARMFKLFHGKLKKKRGSGDEESDAPK